MFKKILVPVDIDYPDTARSVYEKAAAIAGLSEAEVKIVAVMPGFGMPIVASYIPETVRRETEKKYRDSVEAFVRDNCGPSVTFTVKTGKNWEEIVKAADQWGADLIVVYHNHHREINEVFSHSCSHRVADHAHCSVLRLRNVIG